MCTLVLGSFKFAYHAYMDTNGKLCVCHRVTVTMYVCSSRRNKKNPFKRINRAEKRNRHTCKWREGLRAAHAVQGEY